LSDAGAVAGFERHHHADGPEQRAAEIGDRQPRFHRSASFFARDAHPAGKGLHEDVVGALLRARAVRAKAADTAIDQPRVDLLELVIAEPKTLKRADPEIVD